MVEVKVDRIDGISSFISNLNRSLFILLKYWEIYMTECSTLRYVQNLLKTSSTVPVQLDQQSWKNYRTFHKYLVESLCKFWVRKMYNFYESFEKIKFENWIFLRFNMKFWI